MNKKSGSPFIFLTCTVLIIIFLSGCSEESAGLENTIKFSISGESLNYIDFQKIRSDDDLKIIRKEFETIFNNERSILHFNEIKWIAFTDSGKVISGTNKNMIDTYFMGLWLSKKGFNDYNCKGVKIWKRVNNLALIQKTKEVGIYGNIIIIGNNNIVKKSVENSKLKKTYGYGEILEKLPEGISYRFSHKSCLGQEVPYGISVYKENNDTLAVFGVIKYPEEEIAQNGENELKESLKLNDNAFDIEVRREGETLKFTEKISINDFTSTGKEFLRWHESCPSSSFLDVKSVDLSF